MLTGNLGQEEFMTSWKETTLLLLVTVVIGVVALAILEAKTWSEAAAYAALIVLTLLVGSILQKKIVPRTRTTRR